VLLEAVVPGRAALQQLACLRDLQAVADETHLDLLAAVGVPDAVVGAGEAHRTVAGDLTHDGASAARGTRPWRERLGQRSHAGAAREARDEHAAVADLEQVAGGGVRVREVVLVRREPETALVPCDDAVVTRERGHLLEPDPVIAARAVTEHDDRRVEPGAPHLARHAAFEHEVFAALNTAHLRDGAFVWVERGQRCPTPVQILHLSTQNEAAGYPRCLAIVEAGAALTLIEDFASLAEIVYFNDPVTEIVAGEGAHVRHVRVQREAGGAFHIGRCAVALAKDAHYSSHSVALGARISRLDLDVLQQGEGVEVQMDGLALISGRQLADTHSLMDHARPHGRCRQLHKCIVGGAAHAVFNGRIVVRPGAQLTDSAQQSRNLLLSGKAHVDTKPQLEIFADDVKCSHGATVGQLDAEQLFYLSSRGVPEGKARNLLTYAFGAEVIDRIPVPSLVVQLEETVLAQTQTAGQP